MNKRRSHLTMSTCCSSYIGGISACCGPSAFRAHSLLLQPSSLLGQRYGFQPVISRNTATTFVKDLLSNSLQLWKHIKLIVQLCPSIKASHLLVPNCGLAHPPLQQSFSPNCFFITIRRSGRERIALHYRRKGQLRTDAPIPWVSWVAPNGRARADEEAGELRGCLA